MQKMMRQIIFTIILALTAGSLFINCAGEGDVVSAPPSKGQGGSMARFTIAGDYLYIVDQSNLLPFEIADKDNLIARPTIEIGTGIETIFPYNDMLFVGARNGMYIYDLESPESPQLLSNYIHITACDPVVVNGNTAYVTLRAGTNCGGGINQLEVIDVTDPANPQLKNTVSMGNPYGLGVVDSLLFVCEGDQGLKLLNVKDPYNISVIDTARDINGYDVIPLVEQKVLMMVGDNGFAQYDFSDPYQLKLLSKIDVAED
jgi:hypothetical protein